MGTYILLGFGYIVGCVVTSIIAQRNKRSDESKQIEGLPELNRLEGSKSEVSPYPEKTALEAMREAGLVIHEEQAAPRAELLGHFFIQPNWSFVKCGTCKQQEEFELLKIVQEFSENHVRCGIGVRLLRVATICNKCGMLHVVEPFTLWSGGPTLVRTGHLAQNIFDHLQEMPVGEEDEPGEVTQRLTRAELDQKISDLEAELNEAKLQKLKLEHRDGLGQSAEPYRGGKEAEKLH